jgi:hypothetical protein
MRAYSISDRHRINTITSSTAFSFRMFSGMANIYQTHKHIYKPVTYNAAEVGYDAMYPGVHVILHPQNSALLHH